MHRRGDIGVQGNPRSTSKFSPPYVSDDAVRNESNSSSPLHCYQRGTSEEPGIDMVEKVQRPLVSSLVHGREESPGGSGQESHNLLGKGQAFAGKAGVSSGNSMGGRPAAANAARERNRVQTLRHAFLELQRTLPSVPPDTKLSKLDVLILATTYIAHLTRSLQEEDESSTSHHPNTPKCSGTSSPELLGTLHSGDGYLHPVKKWPMRSRLYIGASGQFLHQSMTTENHNEEENLQ